MSFEDDAIVRKKTSTDIMPYMENSITIAKSNSQTSENRALLCLTMQTKIIAGFYLSYVIGDFIFQIVANEAFDIGKDFDCIDDTVVVPLTNTGAAFLMVQSILLLSFTVMVLIVFYAIPDRYKLIAKKRKKIRKVSKQHSLNVEGDSLFRSQARHTSTGVEALLKEHMVDS